MDVGEVQAGPRQRHGPGVGEDRANVGYDDEEDDQVEGNDIGSSQQTEDKNVDHGEVTQVDLVIMSAQGSRNTSQLRRSFKSLIIITNKLKACSFKGSNIKSFKNNLQGALVRLQGRALKRALRP